MFEHVWTIEILAYNTHGLLTIQLELNSKNKIFRDLEAIPDGTVVK